MSKQTTTCRICESACGMLASIQSDRVQLAPDPEHPISQGYACVKGTRFSEQVLHHPDRLRQPWVQGQPTSWDDALAFITDRWRSSVARYGRQSIALYSGNAMGHSIGGVLAVSSLQRAIGTSHHYSCLTLDNSEMFVVAEEVFGGAMTTFVADYAASDFVLLLGTDPLSSHASQAQSQPRAGDALRTRARENQLVVVDPRPSSTAAKASLHLQPRPGTDVFLLAGLVRWVLAHASIDRPKVEREALWKACESFTLSRVATVTGLEVSQLEELAVRWLDAKRPLVWSGLGVLLSAQGTLGWWLTVVLQVITAGLNHSGGWKWQPGALQLPWWLSRFGPPGRDVHVRATSGHPAILGTLAAATFPDAVRTGKPPVRSLVVFGGDPLHAMPDTAGVRSAFDQLDLLISVDLFRRGTAAQADVVLPAATWLERDELAVHIDHQRPVSHLRLDRRVIEPQGLVRTDWEIAVALGECLGRGPFGLPLSGRSIYKRLSPTGLARMAARLSGVPKQALESAIGHLRPSSSSSPPRARLAVPEFCRALRALPDPPNGLRLVTSARPIAKMNHWIGESNIGRAAVHPSTAAAGPAKLRGPAGSIDVEVVHNESLKPGVVVLPYGQGPANPNQVVSRRDLEPFSGQPISNGTIVELHPHRPASD